MNKKQKNVFFGTLLALLGIFSFVQAGSIGDVQLRFCNDVEVSSGVFHPELVKNLSLEMERGEKKSLCMQFTNLGAEPITIQENFIDGTVTNSAARNKACKDETHTENFGKYASGDTSPFTLAPGQKVIKHADLQFDGNVAGQVYGCVTFFESKELDKTQGGMFKILVRRANFVDVLLDGDILSSLIWLDQPNTKKNYSKNAKIFLTKSQEIKGYELLLGFKNNGSISQSLQVSGVMQGMFGQERLVFNQKRVVPAGDTIALKELVKSLPWYGGFVSLHFNVQHNAIITFDGDEVTDAMKKTYTMQEEAHFFLFTRWLLLFVALFCVMIYVLFFLIIRHKKHQKHMKRHPHSHNSYAIKQRAKHKIEAKTKKPTTKPTTKPKSKLKK